MSKSSKEKNEVADLLAEVSVVRNDCDLDLLMFLYRHPRTVLTSEQIAAFVGYPMNRVAESLDVFIAAGMLERTQNAMHAARIYLLKVDGPKGGSLKGLLTMASSRQGRQRIINVLRAANLPNESAADPKDKGRRLRIA